MSVLLPIAFVALVAVAAFFASDGKSASPADQPTPAPPGSRGEIRDGWGPLVWNRQFAEGLGPRLYEWLRRWSWGGPFVISINGQFGALRFGPAAEAFQLDAFNKGNSNTADLSKTAHGRGGAVDASVVLDGKVRASTDPDPTVQRMYAEYGEVAKQDGFRWGGDFQSPKREPWHVEDPNWRTLPYPPVVNVA